MVERTPLVAIVADGEEIFTALEPAASTLDVLHVPYEKKALSAHHDPDGLREYASTAWERGLRTIIVGEKGASHLAGMIKSFAGAVQLLVVLQYTDDLKGLDSVASALAMPAKVPVAIMGFDTPGAINAAVFAADGLAGVHPEIAAALLEYRARYQEEVLEANGRL